MLVVVFAMALAIAVSGVMMMTSASASRDAQRLRHSTEARYLAEGALEVAKKELVSAIADFEPAPTAGTATIGGVSVDYVIEPTGFSAIEVDPSGIQTLVDGYHINATAEAHGHSIRVDRIVNVEATPIFQFAVFYDNDLEILPGPSMTLGGRVHTNADMYLGCGGTLTMDTNHVRAVGNMYRVRKDDPTKSSGTIDIRRYVVDPYDSSEPAVYVTMPSLADMLAAGVVTKTGYDSNFTAGHDANEDGDYTDAGDWLPWGPGSLDLWSQPTGYMTKGQTVQTADHGTPEIVPPSVSSIAMFEESKVGDFALDPLTGEFVDVGAGNGTHSKGFFHREADLSFIVSEDGSWSAMDGNGFDVTGKVSSAVDIDTVFDARQGGDITVLEIDIDKLAGTGEFPPNGLVYASHYGMGTGLSASGIHLKNGVELLDDLTVVTDGAVYVEGDFNVTSPKSAAVISDAVNLLSNAWTGSKTAGVVPVASETTYNMAFITGNHDTVGSAYNGGLENLPRFHENWSGVNCNLTGSFVNLWTSQYATEKWGKGGVYSPPGRNWIYDESFNNTANLPPFTPMVVLASEVVSW